MAWNNWGNPDEVKAFQSAYGLSRDGIVGPKTAAAMNTPKGMNMLNRFTASPTGLQSTAPATTALSDSQLFNNGKSYTLAGGRTPTTIGNGLSGYAPSGLSMEQLVAQYSPEQLGKMDFSNYDAGSLGTDAASPSWFTENKDAISAGAQGLQALSGLANAYMGYKNYGLAKDMFGFQKAATNANYINAAKDYNTQLQNAGEVGMGLAGNTMDANARAARQAQLDSRKVSESAIK